MTGWQPPVDLDPECLALCKAINEHCPGLTTTESCCGHGESAYMIFLAATTVNALLPLLYWADNCHTGCEGWQVTAYTDCAADHVTFMLEGPAGAFCDAEKIAAFLADSALEAAEKVWPHKPAGFIVQTQPNPRGGTIGDRP